MMLRIGIDTGGTFTDFVIVEDGRISTWKEPSTPDDPARAILAGLDRIGRARNAEVIHGSTVATNALLEGRTARIAFVTNRGFEDLLEIGRQTRPDLYDLAAERPTALVPRDLRFGVSGRLGPDGSEISPVDLPALERLARDLEARGVEAVAICLLHAYADPRHEEAVGGALGTGALPVSLSSRLVPEYREYERASTTAVNAAVAPVVARYIRHLERGLSDRGVRTLRVMGSNGGALSPPSAGAEAVRTILSGPAAGVRATEHVGRQTGRTDLISFDMGGTSTDVCLVPGEARVASDARVAGHPVKISAIDIHTVGAGGGSIAWADPGGALRVGPSSAGADPGPACYGHGGPPTVTDANLVLGRLVADRFLDGRMPLDEGAARAAIELLAGALGLDLPAAAEGIVQVAEATMSRAIRVISLFRGFEPSAFSLLAFGGAGGLHAAAIAESLEIEEAIVPAEPGVFSAFGMTVADVIRDRVASVLSLAGEIDDASIEEIFGKVEATCREDLGADGVEEDRVSLRRSLDLRYSGQSYELEIPWSKGRGWLAAFHREHEKRYGYARRGLPIELVALRVRGIGRVDPPAPAPVGRAGAGLEAALRGRRKLTWRGAAAEARIWERAGLPPEEMIEGPAIIVEAGSTVLLPPGWAARRDEWGHLRLARNR